MNPYRNPNDLDLLTHLAASSSLFDAIPYEEVHALAEILRIPTAASQLEGAQRVKRAMLELLAIER
jgi:hypothetical protein